MSHSFPVNCLMTVLIMLYVLARIRHWFVRDRDLSPNLATLERLEQQSQLCWPRYGHVVGIC